MFTIAEKTRDIHSFAGSTLFSTLGMNTSDLLRGTVRTYPIENTIERRGRQTRTVYRKVRKAEVDHRASDCAEGTA